MLDISNLTRGRIRIFFEDFLDAFIENRSLEFGITATNGTADDNSG